MTFKQALDELIRRHTLAGSTTAQIKAALEQALAETEDSEEDTE